MTSFRIPQAQGRPLGISSSDIGSTKCFLVSRAFVHWYGPCPGSPAVVYLGPVIPLSSLVSG